MWSGNIKHFPKFLNASLFYFSKLSNREDTNMLQITLSLDMYVFVLFKYELLNR